MTSSMSINTALKRHAAPGLVAFLGTALPEIQDTWWWGSSPMARRAMSGPET